MSNTELWDSVYTTDPKHTKDFKRTGGFSGTAIKPLYLIHKATQLWGPMGDAWGAESGEPVIAGNFVFIKARLWHPGKDGKAWVEHWGGDLLMKGDKPNDEAAKMAFTDAIGKCLVQLGFSADVHMGEFDGNKYVEPAPKASKAIFANASLRRSYCDYVLKKIEGSETVAEAKEHFKSEVPKLTEMEASGNDHDLLAVEEIKKQFQAKVALFQDKATHDQQREDFKQRA